MRILISDTAIAERVKELGKEISSDYRGKRPVFVCILRGAFMFLSDLLRHIDIDLMVDFMAISSYGNLRVSSGVVKIVLDLSTDIEGRDVIVVEDIVDTGLTLSYILKTLSVRNPKSLKVCVLLDKKENRRVNVPLDYVGFEIPSQFVVGYGLDFGQKYRNLPYVAVLKNQISKIKIQK
jgi:hypoxanthine phosphoribosyltransferase